MFNALDHLKKYDIEITNINNDTYGQLFRVYFYHGILLKHIPELINNDFKTILQNKGV